LLPYLPLVVVATGLVTALPIVLATSILPSGGPLLMVTAAALTVTISLVAGSAAAAAWKRSQRSRDVVFADLMLWGWLRGCWTERRLRQVSALHESARRAGPRVSMELLARLSTLLESRDAYTHGHSQRVARHAKRIAETMHLPPGESAKIVTAAAVHDVGKAHTPRSILNNPTDLTDAEFGVLKRHAADGAEMLADVGDAEITAMVRHHHERLDGHGYPDGLIGEEIPLGARIIAVADTFDSITSNRAYRSARTHKQALEVLSKQAGSQLDGKAVGAFLHSYGGRRRVASLAFASVASQRMLAWLQAPSLSLAVSVGPAPILTVFGVAGALALSHGLHHSMPSARPAHPQLAVARAHRPVVPPVLSATSLKGATSSGAGPRPATRRHGRRLEATHESPTAAAYAGAGSETAGAQDTGSHITSTRASSAEVHASAPAPEMSSTQATSAAVPPAGQPPALPVAAAGPPQVPQVAQPQLRPVAPSAPTSRVEVPPAKVPPVRIPEAAGAVAIP
jgi:HD-GYP domain-containing protein (c-di-GMP phosphodiesterase class II)